MTQAYDELTEIAGEYGLTLTFEFMPQVFPEDTKSTDMSMKWLVTVRHRGNPLLATTYTQGVAHCPSYSGVKWGRGLTVAQLANLRRDCASPQPKGGPKEPLTALWCIASDCLTVMNCGSFEEWARELGYDTDSRKAEGIYKEIVTQYLSLKRAIGDEEIETLAAVEL
jgi:hypothetical protein